MFKTQIFIVLSVQKTQIFIVLSVQSLQKIKQKPK